MVAGGKAPERYAMWSLKSLSRQGEIMGIPGVWGGGGGLVVCCWWMCARGKVGHRGVGAAMSSAWLHLRQWVSLADLCQREAKGDAEPRRLKTLARRRTRCTFSSCCVFLSRINRFRVTREQTNIKTIWWKHTPDIWIALYTGYD